MTLLMTAEIHSLECDGGVCVGGGGLSKSVCGSQRAERGTSGV